ncbi:MAG: lipopolysaccharide heptosyltransferase family protein, partial [Ignavibacteriaceae bacterium]
MNNTQLRILILRPDRLGDVVLSTPLPREIKKVFPDAFVSVLVRNYTKDIYINNPFVDEILVDEELGNSFWQRVKRIRSFSFTHGIALLPTEKNNWLLFFSGIKIRISVGHKFYQFLSNAKSIYRRKYIPLRNEADYCLDALRKIGIENPDSAVSIYLSDKEKKRALEFRESFLINKRILVGIHATCGKSAPNLSLKEYRKLAELLVLQKDIQVFITEKEIPDELKNIEGVSYYFENLSLRDSII